MSYSVELAGGVKIFGEYPSPSLSLSDELSVFGSPK